MSISIPLPKEQLIDMYSKMLLARSFDEKAYELFTKGVIPCGIHSGVGQEAIAVGVMPSVREDDYFVCSHRGHQQTLVKGADVKRMMAELFAKETGYCRGKGGSLHIADFARNVSIVSICGAQVPMAAGMALSFKLRKTDQVCFCFFGDGASNQGAFHEGINLAAIWKLPVIFICENNQYAVSIPVSKSTAVKDIATRAVAYDIPGVVVDGMDVISIHKVISEAVKRAREGEGPTLVECKTYRYHGHSRGDPPYGPYRTKEEWEEWKKKDPVDMYRKLLMDAKILTKEKDEAIQREVAETMEEAVKFAMESPFPGPESVLEDIYV